MRLPALIAFTWISIACTAQSGYHLSFRIKGWKDTTVYLGHYYGESTFIRDTAQVKNGAFTFDGNAPLSQGVYFLVLGKSRLFDFVVSSDQTFSMETSSDDYYANLKISGDEDNKLFFDNISYNQERYKEAEPFIKVLQDTTLTDDQKKNARTEYLKINDQVLAHQRALVKDHPQTLTARLLKATTPIEVPDPPKKPDGTIDSTFQFRYYRDHFFDNFDLADDALIRMPKPFYMEKMKEYLDKLFLQQPDTISNAIYRLVERAKPNKETYKYSVYTSLFLYQTPEIMGLDEVFVNVYKKYFETGEMDFWATASIKKTMKEHADKVGRAMIGRTAPNMIMQDQYEQPKSMYDIKKRYTLIWFFDPDCGHCRTETPKLVDFYSKNRQKFDFEVFAVSIDTSMKKMKDYIKEMKMTWITVNGPRSYINEHFKNLYYADTTPTLYVLDDKKKVIARKLPVEKLDEFLANYDRWVRKKAPGSNKGT